MTTPTPTPARPSTAAAQVAQVQRALAAQRHVRGPLVMQSVAGARLAAILHTAAQDLWDLATEPDAAQMWEEARAIASRVLAACPSSPPAVESDAPSCPSCGSLMIPTGKCHGCPCCGTSNGCS